MQVAVAAVEVEPLRGLVGLSLVWLSLILPGLQSVRLQAVPLWMLVRLTQRPSHVIGVDLKCLHPPVSWRLQSLSVQIHDKHHQLCEGIGFAGQMWRQGQVGSQLTRLLPAGFGVLRWRLWEFWLGAAGMLWGSQLGVAGV